MDTVSIKPSDPEMAELVARFLDGRLDEAQRGRLDQRLREDPDARAYCAERLRFAAMLRETLNPQRVELCESRRMIIEQGTCGPEWSLEENRSVSYGAKRFAEGPVPTRFRWWLAPLALACGGVAVFSWFHLRPTAGTPLAPKLELRNAGFEATDLGLTPRGISLSLVDWQDQFPVSLADLCEIGRVSNGKIYAKSGKNVVRLQPRGFLNQELLRSDGSKLLALPGTRIRVSGWAHLDEPAHGQLRGALSFIASGRPDTIRYEACKSTCPIREAGWQHFSIELKVEEKLLRKPIHVAGAVENLTPYDLTGHELYLTLENRPEEPVVLLLDDLSIEELKE